MLLKDNSSISFLEPRQKKDSILHLAVGPRRRKISFNIRSVTKAPIYKKGNKYYIDIMLDTKTNIKHLGFQQDVNEVRKRILFHAADGVVEKMNKLQSVYHDIWKVRQRKETRSMAVTLEILPDCQFLKSNRANRLYYDSPEFIKKGDEVDLIVVFSGYEQSVFLKPRFIVYKIKRFFNSELQIEDLRYITSALDPAEVDDEAYSEQYSKKFTKIKNPSK